MRRLKNYVFVLALLVAGCGGGTAQQAGPPLTGKQPQAARAAASATPSNAPASADGYRGAPTPAIAPHPGLGTLWGEDRDSHVNQAQFTRRTPARPVAVLSLYYNDRAGVAAMIGSGQRPDSVDNVFTDADSRLAVRLLDGKGAPLPSVHAGGRTYVVGENGQRYVIDVRNPTGNRVEVVATVDGLDVLDGRPGSYAKRGYLLAPGASLQIDGFRRSADSVAAFRFGAVSNSYAELKGEGRNVGVIGVAFFDEAGSTWPWTEREISRRKSADPFPGQYAQPPR
jgi:hypothetical protein